MRKAIVPRSIGLRLLCALVSGLAAVPRFASAQETNVAPAGAVSVAIPVLTSAADVRRARQQESEKGFALKVRGVVTCVQPEHRAFVIQDSSAGLYVVEAGAGDFANPRLGDVVEVEGVSDHGIASATRIDRIGHGELPEAVQPDWDQLINGSLDCRWVEIQGVMESWTDRPNGWSRVNLRVRGGTLKLDVLKSQIKPGPLERYDNAVTRWRGCLFAAWDPANGRVKAGQIRFYGADVSVDEALEADVFSIPRKSVAALTRYDPDWDAFRRVKVSGQIVHVRGNDFFLMDGTDGLRFVPNRPCVLKRGDVVDVVGFPQLSGAAPVLRGAVVRKTGESPLPEPKRIGANDLVQLSLDAIRVRVEGTLASLRQTPTNLVMEMQAGSWRFLARLNAGEQSVPALRVGSRLDLTGVYCAQGGYKALGEDVAAVDLLLDSPADIAVLSTPPWWTLQKLLVVLGALAIALVLSALWITQLKKQVGARTLELAAQHRQRQRIEQQRAMEEERARIAQDLHDELGSGLTEIGMLAERSKSVSTAPEKRNQYLAQMNDKARELVSALDEIVWAMNPRHNSLASLVSYFSLYADRFLGLANIQWRLDDSGSQRDRFVDSHERHQLFLAFKEALNNVVRHSGATEVRVSVQARNGELTVVISDNGHGIANGERTDEMDGITNMRARVEKLGGKFAINGSAAGPGTTVRFSIPSH